MKFRRAHNSYLNFNVHRGAGRFQKFSRWASRTTGHPITFEFAILIILIWSLTGPIFHFSDTWQLVINTGTTIITFLMVFLIQSTQNRDSAAMHLKLDELIRSTHGCHNALLDIEELSEQELDQLKASYEQLAEKAIKDLRTGKSDLGTPAIRNQNGKKMETKR